jgi:hypothetical protein
MAVGPLPPYPQGTRSAPGKDERPCSSFPGGNLGLDLMAPLPEIDGVYRVALEWTNDTYPSMVAANVMHFGQDGGNASDLFGKLDAHATATMWGHTTGTTHVSRIRITKLDGVSPTYDAPPTTVARWKGTQTGSAVNPQVAALVKLVTGARGRSYRGRIFLPFVDESLTTGAVFGSALLTSMQGAWDTFVSAMHTDGADLVVASYKLSTAATVTSQLVERHTATQRRRNHRDST